MATTTNYGWTTPDDTALVKDGAAAIRTLGSSVDTTTKALNPSTTLGDIEYRSATANTNTRLPIGTTGQVLAVVGGVPAWQTGTTGDIEGVTAGTGLSGGGTSGTVTVAFDYGVGNQAIENAQTGTTYTLALTDAGKMVTLTNASAITLTIPTNATAAFPVNTRIDLLQYGAGQVTIAGAGVTIQSSGAKLKLTGQYSGASLWKKATDTWVLIGDITA
jgi:hypothetical protein